MHLIFSTWRGIISPCLCHRVVMNRKSNHICWDLCGAYFQVWGPIGDPHEDQRGSDAGVLTLECRCEGSMMASSCGILVTWGPHQAEGNIVPVLGQRWAAHRKQMLLPSFLMPSPRDPRQSAFVPPWASTHLGVVLNPDLGWGRPQLWSPRDAVHSCTGPTCGWRAG